MYNKRYKRRKFLFFFFFPLLWLLVSAIVMWLWNAILPDLLHTNTITFWQSAGLLLLSRILFSGFRFNPSGNRPQWGNRWGNMREKWMTMSEEDRSKFRKRNAQPLPAGRKERREGVGSNCLTWRALGKAWDSLFRLPNLHKTQC